MREYVQRVCELGKSGQGVKKQRLQAGFSVKSEKERENSTKRHAVSVLGALAKKCENSMTNTYERVGASALPSGIMISL